MAAKTPPRKLAEIVKDLRGHVLGPVNWDRWTVTELFNELERAVNWAPQKTLPDNAGEKGGS